MDSAVGTMKDTHSVLLPHFPMASLFKFPRSVCSCILYPFALSVSCRPRPPKSGFSCPHEEKQQFRCSLMPTRRFENVGSKKMFRTFIVLSEVAGCHGLVVFPMFSLFCVFYIALIFFCQFVLTLFCHET